MCLCTKDFQTLFVMIARFSFASRDSYFDELLTKKIAKIFFFLHVKYPKIPRAASFYVFRFVMTMFLGNGVYF